MTLLAALALSDRFRVHPLRPGDKRAILTDWPNQASQDPETIRAWWARYPDANIGIATGRGLVVLDVDGDTGWRSLARVAETDIETAMVATPKGRHFYFRTELIVPNSVGKLGPGLDIRGERGYVVGPGSVVDGNTYQWLDDRDRLQVLPDWLLAAPERRPVTAHDPVGRMGIIPVGQQNDQLFRIASRLRGLGLGHEAILAELKTIPLEPDPDRPAWTENDYRVIVGSVMRYPAGEVPATIVHGAIQRPPEAPNPPKRVLSQARPESVMADVHWRMAGEIQEARVEWLWDGRIPYGKLTIIDGNPGVGKTFIGLDLAARVSCGRGMPPRHGTADPARARGVVVLMPEDDNADTIVPRLRAMDANLSKVAIISKPFDLTSPDGIDLLERACDAADARLVVIDPLLTYLGSGNTDVHRDRDVRRALDPLIEVAIRRHLALVGVRHLNKGGKDAGSAMYRGMGSIAITAVARSVMMAGKDPSDPLRSILAVVKNNMAAPVKGLRYELKALETEPWLAKIEWLGESDVSADLLAAGGGDPDDMTARQEATRMLDWMCQPGVGVSSQEIYDQANAQGISKATLHRARVNAGIETQRNHDTSGRSTWLRPIGGAGDADG